MKALCVLALAATTLAAAADGAAGFAASAPVSVQGAESLQRLRLPLAVLQATRRPGWADLRVLDARGTALPFAWAAALAASPAAPTRQPLAPLPWPATAQGQPAPQVKIEWRGDGSVLRIEHSGLPGAAAPPAEPRAWLLDLQALGTSRPAALWLDWAPQTAAGLVLPVRAEASPDAQQWQPVGQAVLVELATPAARQVLQQRLALSALSSGQRYLRLVADSPWPLRAAAAEFDAAAAADEPALEQLRLPVPADGVLDLGTALPLKRLRFTLPGEAGVLPLALERQGSGPGQASSWWLVASHTAWRLQQGGTWLESPPLTLDGQAARHWRLRAAGPAPGVLPTQVELAWTAPQIVFVASGQAPYRLVVGRADAPDAALPLATLLPAYRPGDEHRLPAAGLGPLQAGDTAGDGWGHTSPEQRKRWWLWATLAATVAVLAGLAWRLAREMRSSPEPRSTAAEPPSGEQP